MVDVLSESVIFFETVNFSERMITRSVSEGRKPYPHSLADAF